MTPKVDISEATGLPYAVDRFAQGGPTVNPIAGAPQMKTTAMQKDLASQTVQEIGNPRASAQAAIQGQQAVKSLQEQEAMGHLQRRHPRHRDVQDARQHLRRHPGR